MDCFKYIQTLVWWNNGFNAFSFRIKAESEISPGESIVFTNQTDALSQIPIKATRRRLSFESGRISGSDRDFIASIKLSPTVFLIVPELNDPVPVIVERDSFVVLNEIDPLSPIEFSVTFSNPVSTL